MRTDKRVNGPRHCAASPTHCIRDAMHRPRHDGARSTATRKRPRTRSSCSGAARRVKFNRSPRSRSTSYPPGTSPLKAIENLPGVNFQSADPYGAYEWSTRITIRGFNQNRLGFTLDGVPLGDMTYGNHNGLHISRAIPSELVEQRNAVARHRLARIPLRQAISAAQSNSFPRPHRRIRRRRRADASAPIGAPYVCGSTLASSATGTRAYSQSRTRPPKNGEAAAIRTCAMYTLKLVQPIGAAKFTVRTTTTPIAWRSTTKISRTTSSRGAASIGTTITRIGMRPSAAQTRRQRQNDAISCDDAYWNASGLRKDDLGLSRARSAVRRFAALGQRRLTCTRTMAKAFGALRMCKRREARRFRSARPNTTWLATAS